MEGQLAAARAHPAVVASMVVAGVAVTACALVAIAYMLDWLPSRGAVPTPVSAATPGQQASATASDLALLPGETVVNAPEPPGPTTPSFAKRAAETPKPSPMPAVPPPKGAASPSTAAKSSSVARPAPPPAPAPPAYARNVPREEPPRARNYCVNCGTVATITAYAGDEWDVRVRFEDGSMETLRYRELPRLRIGERVRLEDGLLVRE